MKRKLQLSEVFINLRAGDSLKDEKFLEKIKQLVKDDFFECEAVVTANWRER